MRKIRFAMMIFLTAVAAAVAKPVVAQGCDDCPRTIPGMTSCTWNECGYLGGSCYECLYTCNDQGYEAWCSVKTCEPGVVYCEL